MDSRDTGKNIKEENGALELISTYFVNSHPTGDPVGLNKQTMPLLAYPARTHFIFDADKLDNEKISIIRQTFRHFFA